MRIEGLQRTLKVGPGAFRLFLAMVVVLHHSTPLRLGEWAVGLFFCLSGYWIARMWTERYSKLNRPYFEFIASRWWRLAPVLFVTAGIVGVAVLLGVNAGDRGVFHKIGWWASQPLIAGSTLFGRLLPPVWSLDVEMQFYIVAPLLLALLLQRSLAIQGGMLLVSLAWCWIVHWRGGAGETARLDIWLGIFLIGMVAAANRWRPTTNMAVASGTTVLVLFAIAAAAPLSRPWILMRGSSGLSAPIWLAGSLSVAAIVLSTPLAIWTTATPSSTADRFLGDLSFPVYLFHWLPRSWYYEHMHSAKGPAAVAFLLVANLLIAVAGGALILICVDRPFQRLRARWLRRGIDLRRAHALVEAPTSATAGTI